MGSDSRERAALRALGRCVPLVLALSFPSCWDFQPDPATGPTELSPGRYVDVTIEYRQPAHCANTEGTCDARVVFFGSWMASREPAGVVLETRYSPYFWSATVRNVPVNWPPPNFPGDEPQPHVVRIWDPHLQGTQTNGATALRLSVGGQPIYYLEDAGTPLEAGLVYIDDNGVGHNPLF